LILFVTSVFVGAYSATIILSGVLPPVIGWLGALVALVGVIGSAAVATTANAIFYFAFVGFISFLVWALIVSIFMLRAPREVVEVDVVVVAEASAT
jgi:hypothetical protein